MTVKPIPEGYHSVTPYLIVSGVAGLIDFINQAFDGVEIERLQRPDGTIMHAEVRIGDSIVMMGEPSTEFTPMPASLHLYVEDTDQVYRRALEAGGISIQEPADQFYGDRSAGVKDAAGNFWWIATHIKDVSAEELIHQTRGG
jgi:uncharacterized glyoxalase superfamily protein PhnB